METAEVQTRVAMPIDYSAKVLTDGYEIERNLPQYVGSQALLYNELSALFGEVSTTNLSRAPDGRWYFWLPKFDPEIRYVEEVHLPKELENYLNARVAYLDGLNKKLSHEYSVFPRVEVRIGDQNLIDLGRASSRRLHFDGDTYRPGSVMMVETLNRGPTVRGTYALGLSGNIIEMMPGESLLFASRGFAVTPPALHGTPPTEGERIFIRYNGPSPGLPQIRFADGNGTQLF